jgi:hypothetical protein
MIRPDGVVSKNRIGQRTVVCSRLVWSVRDAATVRSTHTIPKSTMEVAVNERVSECNLRLIIL